jgi:hypothetical protein
MPTFLAMISAPGMSIAATMKNAAEEKSPGTSISIGESSRPPLMKTVRPSTRRSAPCAGSILSV